MFGVTLPCNRALTFAHDAAFGSKQMIEMQMAFCKASALL